MNGLEKIRAFMIANNDTAGLPLVDVMIGLAAKMGDAPALAGLIDLAVNAAAMSGDVAQQDRVMVAMATGSQNLLTAHLAQRQGVECTLVPRWVGDTAGNA